MSPAVSSSSADVLFNLIDYDHRAKLCQVRNLVIAPCMCNAGLLGARCLGSINGFWHSGARACWARDDILICKTTIQQAS